MEFYIRKDSLVAEMGCLSSVSDRKGPIPILENTLIRSNGTKIKLTATDLDLSIFSECATEQIAGEGKLCVPTKKLFDIVKLMPEGIIKISGDANQWLKVQARGSNYKIPGANPEMFPDVPTPPEDWLFVPAKALRMILKGVAFSASSTDDNRFAIGGVKIEINESDITMVATDGHRISVASGPLDSLMLNTMDTLLPAKGVGELIRLLADYEGEVGISQKENGLFFQIGKRILHSRLLTGRFPAYQPAFQQTYPFAAAFKADVLSLSLKRTMQVSDNKLGGVTFNFLPEKLVLNAQTAEAGECEEILDSNFNGGTLAIVLSARFLLDYLEQMGSEPIRFDIKDSVTPIVLSNTKEKMTYKYLLIPMRNKATE